MTPGPVLRRVLLGSAVVLLLGLAWTGIEGGITQNRLVLVCWTIALALTAGLASVVWGGTSLLIGVVSGMGAGLIGGGIAWLLRIGAHRTLLP